MADGLDEASIRRLREVGRLLEELNDGELRRQVMEGLRAPANALIPKLRTSVQSLSGAAPSKWKNSAASGLYVTARTTGPAPIISVGLRRSGDSRGGWLMNQGKWRHPLWGNRSRWYSQTVRPGWFDNTVRSEQRRFVSDASVALERAAADIARRIASNSTTSTNPLREGTR